MNVAAIHGRIESSAYTNTTVSGTGLLESFDIQQEEIDRLEGILNEPLEERVDSDVDADSEEEETPALLRQRVAQLKARRFMNDHDPNLVVAGKRSRAPTSTYMDVIRYSVK